MTKKPKKPQTRMAVRTGFKKLSDLYVDDSLGPEDAEPEAEKAPAPRRRRAPRGTATATIVGAAFEAATTPAVRRRLTHVQALAVVVIVPGPAWVAPLAAYVESEFGPRWCFHMRDGTDRRRDPLVDSVDAARDLSRGHCVMGVSYDVALLPASLRSAADIVIRIAPPDGTVLRRAVSRFAGRSPGELEPGIVAGLDLAEIVAAFRPGTGAKDIVGRLEAARRSHAAPARRAPDLRTAVEYGEARRFALDLARDVADLKAGRLDFRQLDRGICLWSRYPGVGKSTYNLSLSQLCGVPLVSTSAGEWFGTGPGHLGSVVQKFRNAVSQARALAAPIAFLAIEEVDAAVPNRGAMSDRNDTFFSVVVAEVLSTLDSTLSDDRSRIVVLGSTTALDRVDPALLRPGRLEKCIEIPLPDAAGALSILRFHLEAELEEDLSPLGPLLAGSTGAEIMHAVRAARRFARHAGRPLSVDDLRNAVLPAEEHPPARLFRMAIHEAAHAVIVLALAAGTVAQVVLRSAGGDGGRTSVLYRDDDLTTRQAIEDRVTVALAARAAERLFTNSVSTGSGGSPDSDIGFCTIEIAALHASFGLRGAPVYLGAGEELLRAVAFDPGLRAAVARDLRRLERRAERLVAANRDAILAVAARLAEKRHLDGAEVEAIARGRLARPPEAGRRNKTNP